jgi:hypothetical protein
MAVTVAPSALTTEIGSTVPARAASFGMKLFGRSEITQRGARTRRR